MHRCTFRCLLGWAGRGLYSPGSLLKAVVVKKNIAAFYKTRSHKTGHGTGAHWHSLTQVHHGSRLSDSCEDGEALSSVHSTALAAGKLIHNLSALRWPCEERLRYAASAASQFYQKEFYRRFTKPPSRALEGPKYAVAETRSGVTPRGESGEARVRLAAV